MFKIKSIVARSVFFIFASLLATYTAAETNVAIMNYQAVLFNSLAAEDATVQLRTALADIQTRLEEIQQGMTSRQTTLETDVDILTDEEILTYQQEVQAMAVEQQQIAANIQQAQQKSRSDFIAYYQPVIRDLVEKYLENKNFNLVLDSQAVLWNVDTPDITEEILVKFDEQYSAQK